MRVLLTGGTGYVGSHAAAALVRSGHEVRLLVRSPDRVATSLGPLGVSVPDVAVGDITDVGSIDAALAGCDAVVHAASCTRSIRVPHRRSPPRTCGGPG